MANHEVILQPAYLLHARPYRDTSLLLEFFTEEHGRVSAIARGAKGPRSRFRGVLQPFFSLLISWCGRSELMTLTHAEATGYAAPLSGEGLICGLYINELLMRLLHRYDPHPQLYLAYQTALKLLSESDKRQVALRWFEKQLLSELGYALQLNQEADTGDPILSDQIYYYEPARGLLPSNQQLQFRSDYYLFHGRSLLALHQDDLTERDFLRDAKRLLRIALRELLGDKPIRSRELFL